MEFYTEKNGLAQFWNRDHTRLEWAKWVYHHPEQTEKLVEYLLQIVTDGTSLAEINARLDANDIVDAHQEESIQHILSGESSAISMQALQELMQSLL